MDELKVPTVRHLLNLILSEVDDLCPGVDPRVLEIVCVQFVVTLLELDRDPRAKY